MKRPFISRRLLPPRHRLPRWLFSAAAALVGAATAPAAPEPVAVLAQVFNGYKRERLSDQSFKPERYTFGEGGCYTRPVANPSLDQLKFLDVARVVAGPLHRLNYLPARTAHEAELLILVYWGALEGSRSRWLTLDFNFGSLERGSLDYRNARILGYTEALERAHFAPHMSFCQDIMAEVGDNRYYVVLQAYDFRTAAKEKKLKPLWFARISVSERGNFARALDHMAWSASRFYGQDSHGLHRHMVPEGKIEIGPVQVIEIVGP